MTEINQFEAILHDAVTQLRVDQKFLYGWTKLEVSICRNHAADRTMITGTSASLRQVKQLKQQVSEIVGPPITSSFLWDIRLIAAHGLATMSGSALSLRANWSSVKPSATLEVASFNGPLQILGKHKDAILVRGRDACLGWTDSKNLVSYPQRDSNLQQSSFTVARSTNNRKQSDAGWLGTPYQFGGNTRAAIDCSALVQRIYFARYNRLLPRHSVAQFNICSKRSPNVQRAPFELFFGRNHKSDPWHVGLLKVVARSSELRVMHASSGRNRVVNDSLRFLKTCFREILFGIPDPKICSSVWSRQ